VNILIFPGGLAGRGLVQWHGLLVFILDPSADLLAALAAPKDEAAAGVGASRVAVDAPPLSV
jgi:hypothetical protein